MAHELLKPNKNSIVRTLAVGAFLIGVSEVARAVVDSKRGTVAGVNSYLSETGPSYIILPGCGQNNEELEPLYERYLSRLDGSRHYAFQRRGKYSQDITNDAIMEACERDGERDRVFICTSMALMAFMNCMLNDETRDRVGRIQSLKSLSGITSRDDLTPDMQKALRISTLTPALPTVGTMHNLVRVKQAMKPIQHGEGITSQDARNHHLSTARMHYRTVSTMRAYIADTEPLEPGALAMVAGRNPDFGIDHITAPHDHVADSERAAEQLEHVFKVPVHHIVDDRRTHVSVDHAGDLEFFEPVMESLSPYLADTNVV